MPYRPLVREWLSLIARCTVLVPAAETMMAPLLGVTVSPAGALADQRTRAAARPPPWMVRVVAAAVPGAAVTALGWLERNGLPACPAPGRPATAPLMTSLSTFTPLPSHVSSWPP